MGIDFTCPFPICAITRFLGSIHGYTCGPGLQPAVLAPRCVAASLASAFSPALSSASQAVVNSPAGNRLYSGVELLVTRGLNTQREWVLRTFAPHVAAVSNFPPTMRTQSLLHECLRRTRSLFENTLWGRCWVGGFGILRVFKSSYLLIQLFIALISLLIFFFCSLDISVSEALIQLLI